MNYEVGQVRYKQYKIQYYIILQHINDYFRNNTLLALFY